MLIDAEGFCASQPCLAGILAVQDIACSVADGVHQGASPPRAGGPGLRRVESSQRSVRIAHSTAREVSFARAGRPGCSSLQTPVGQRGSRQRHRRLRHTSSTGDAEAGRVGQAVLAAAVMGGNDAAAEASLQFG